MWNSPKTSHFSTGNYFHIPAFTVFRMKFRNNKFHNTAQFLWWDVRKSSSCLRLGSAELQTVKHGVYRNWTWLSKMQNVASAWTVSQMRRWAVSFSTFAFSPSFSQKLMTLCLHKQDLGDAGAHTQMLKHAPFFGDNNIIWQRKASFYALSALPPHREGKLNSVFTQSKEEILNWGLGTMKSHLMIEAKVLETNSSHSLFTQKPLPPKIYLFRQCW